MKNVLSLRIKAIAEGHIPFKSEGKNQIIKTWRETVKSTVGKGGS